METIFGAEQLALVGGADFEKVLSEVLSEWCLEGRSREALEAWTNIEVFVDVVEAIQRLRKAGLTCCLATNQQRYRASYMSQTLRYRELFDREYYSCDLGCIKPDESYFTHIVRDLTLLPTEIALLDDHESNVEGARRVGIHAEVYDGASGIESLAVTLLRFGIRA